LTKDVKFSVQKYQNFKKITKKQLQFQHCRIKN